MIFGSSQTQYAFTRLCCSTIHEFGNMSGSNKGQCLNIFIVAESFYCFLTAIDHIEKSIR